MMGTPPRAVGDLLGSAVPRLGDRLVEIRLRRAWPTLVGADVARRSRPSVLTAGTLTIVVDNSPWLHELTLRAEELRAKIAAHTSDVRAVRFTLGTLDDGEHDERAKRRPSEPLTAADRAEIDDATAAIADPEAAAAARRLMTKAWRFPATRSQ
jgi:hypothetical protein